MDDDLLLDLRIPPRDALGRLEAAISRRPRRALGILKVASEFVGIVRPPEFEIWERSRHAIHAVGRIEERRGGARVRTSFRLSRRSRVLAVAFFVLYALLGFGLVFPEPRALGPLESAAILVFGALAIAVVFYWSARRQREDLRLFLSRVFVDVAGGPPNEGAPSKE